MTTPKMIGVLGGMGPAATADFYQKIIRATPAKVDQDHLKVLIFSNPQVPDRTAAIQGEGPDPLPILVAGAEVLIQGGADLITIPCVTAHHYMEAIYAVKHGEPLERARRLIHEAARHLQGQGAEAILAGCTEVPLILQDGDLPVPIIDPTWILSERECTA